MVFLNTKKGKGYGKMSIDITSSLSIDEINREHEKQSIYGQGAGGSWSSNASGLSWGDKIAERAGGNDIFDTSGAYFVGNQTGNTYFPVTQKNSTEVFNDVNRDQIFRTGVTQNYSVGINFAESNSNTYFGLARFQIFV